MLRIVFTSFLPIFFLIFYFLIRHDHPQFFARFLICVFPFREQRGETLKDVSFIAAVCMSLCLLLNCSCVSGNMLLLTTPPWTTSLLPSLHLLISCTYKYVPQLSKTVHSNNYIKVASQYIAYLLIAKSCICNLCINCNTSYWTSMRKKWLQKISDSYWNDKICKNYRIISYKNVIIIKNKYLIV